MKSDPSPDHLVALARQLQETLPVKHDDLSLAGCNQAGLFKRSHGIGDGRALHSQHLCEQGMRDPQQVVIRPVIHHE